MIDLRLIDELTRKLSEALPPGFAQLRSETEEQFRAILSRAFERMNLVTREEFVAQRMALERTREKLEQLQQQVDALETRE